MESDITAASGDVEIGAPEHPAGRRLAHRVQAAKIRNTGTSPSTE
jgi:hypothetical protein